MSLLSVVFMILKSQSNRVIFFGCQIHEDTVEAELTFFAANLSTKRAELITPDGDRVWVELPDSVLNQNMPGKLPIGQSFKRVDEEWRAYLASEQERADVYRRLADS